MASERSRTDRDAPVHVGPLVVIGLIAAALGVALGLLIDWFPAQGSDKAHVVDTVYDVLLICSVPVFVLVMTVVLYSVWRFRMRPGEEELDGPPIHGNTRLEIIWTAIPAILLVALCSYSYVALRDVEDAKADSLNVRVVGEQFTWTFYYRDASGKEVASPQLYLPRGKPVNFTVQSKDVIHDFWVPAFRVKIDAVPGIDTTLRATPDRLGDYPVICAELCGLGHAAMRQTAHIVEPAEFDDWLSKLGAGGAAGGGGGGGGGQGGGGTADGKAVFMSNGCGGCHALADAGTSGGVGPDLDQGLKGKDAAFIKESIVDPSAEIAKGYSDGIMPPNFGQTIPPAQLDALVKYLAQVTK
jgi:cytochrome c oxidase subunit II